MSGTLRVFNTVSSPFLLKTLGNVLTSEDLLSCSWVVLYLCLCPSFSTASQHSEDRGPRFDPSQVSSKTRRQLNTTNLGEGGRDPRGWEERGKRNSD